MMELKKYLWVVYVLVAVVMFGMFEMIRSFRNRITLLTAQIEQIRVGYEKIDETITQAQNGLVESQKELMTKLSDEMQAQIKDNNQKILAVTQATLKAEFKEVKDGAGTATGENTFAYSDELMNYIRVDATNKNRPLFSYNIKPLTVELNGTLNFDEKDGVTKFWAQPIVVNNPGVAVDIPKMTFTPSAEFNAWVASLRGKDVYLPVHPRYSVGLTVGIEDMGKLGNETKRVVGADFNMHLQSGLGAGVGFIGRTGFVRFSYSFGK